jgi:hypothetical protein
MHWYTGVQEIVPGPWSLLIMALGLNVIGSGLMSSFALVPVAREEDEMFARTAAPIWRRQLFKAL